MTVFPVTAEGQLSRFFTARRCYTSDRYRIKRDFQLFLSNDMKLDDIIVPTQIAVKSSCITIPDYVSGKQTFPTE